MGSMPSPQVEVLIKRIQEALPGYSDLDEAVKAIKQEYRILNADLDIEVEEARSYVAEQLKEVEFLKHPKSSIFQERDDWYFGPQPFDEHWPALERYLIQSKGWDKEDVASIDQASTEIVSFFSNPKNRQSPRFSCRGLVVGHVQSGKTANMTAVIAKALDAGYNTVIVLAGLTNKLRHQTQQRLHEDLVLRRPERWHLLTSHKMEEDFRKPPAGGFLAHSDKAQIAVIKKNVSPLGELKEAIKETLRTSLQKLRVLVIDDECDQASVNSARGELEISAINGRIREILAMFPAVTYVGYTATPFANVLIDPYAGSKDELDDLYPRDFITALPTSMRYFGAEKLFGAEPENPENPSPEEEGLDMIRVIPEDEEAMLQPPNRKERDWFQPKMTPALERSVLYFIMCCAARISRGDGNKHMTMMVHTSTYVIMHERVESLINGWVELNKGGVLNFQSTVADRMRTIWEEEQDRFPSDLAECDWVDVKDVFDCLPEVLSRLEFVVENGSTEDRIDYSGGSKIYIVVGGSILSRGLTLEGLMVSFFLRSSIQYDTLLQMGRWFGYRPGYEDLPRIWMTEALRVRFQALAEIEQEIRDEIERYRIMGLSPMDIAVRIRAIPGMAITAASKMRSATRCAISYWGTHRQTFRFPGNSMDLLSGNWRAAAELINTADALSCRDHDSWNESRKVWRRVPKSTIIRFLRSYHFDETHADLAPSLLVEFISQEDPRLEFWNIGVIETKKGEISKLPLGQAGQVRTVNRARLKGTGEIFDIKALMSRRDMLFDCDIDPPENAKWRDLKLLRKSSVEDRPLLLIYPINKDSKPGAGSKVRRSLGAGHDVIGIGLVFPGSTDEGGEYMTVMIEQPDSEDVEEQEVEQAEQAAAAGVD